MRYLLDTNAVIELLRDSRSTLARRARQERPSDIGLSAIVVHELFFGAFKSRRVTENAALLDALQFAVLEFDKEDAKSAGRLRATLAASGKSVGPYDVLVAGQALARGLVLVTHNTGEFARVAGLVVEDWQA